MRVIGIILLSFTLMDFTTPAKKGDLIHRLIVQPASNLTIDGSTNVNRFQCVITQYSGKDTLVLRQAGPNQRPTFTKGYVGLEASSFNCGNRAMTHDFGKTVKSSQYPVVAIEFISFERMLLYDKGPEKVNGKLKISLAGVTRAFDMECSIETEKSGLIHLKGGRVFTFSDFNLVPPNKLMGIIKVQDSLKVNFHLVLLQYRI